MSHILRSSARLDQARFRDGGRRSSQNAKPQMGGDRALDEPDPLEAYGIGSQLGEQSSPSSEEHGLDVDLQLVDQAQPQRLVCGFGATPDVDDFVPGDSLRLYDRCLHVWYECESGRAATRTPRGRCVGTNTGILKGGSSPQPFRWSYIARPATTAPEFPRTSSIIDGSPPGRRTASPPVPKG